MMEENANIIEELIEKAADYGKSSLQLAKLKALDKISGAISSLLAFSIVIIVLFTFMLFLNLGLALWIGKILGEIYYGFFVCAGFYGISAILIYFFLQKWIKKQVGNAVIKHLLK